MAEDAATTGPDAEPSTSADGAAPAAPPASGGDGGPAEGGSTSAGPAGAGRTTARRWAVRGLMVVVVLGLFTSTLAVWSHRALFNTDVWVENADALVADPAVTSALADKLTDQIVNGLQLQSRLRNRLPQDQQFLAVPLTAGITQLVERLTTEFLQSETFKEYWSKANRIVHDKIVAFLRGDTTRLQLEEGGAVVLDLTPVVAAISAKLQGIVPESVQQEGIQIDKLGIDVPPGEIRTQLEQAFGVQLPQDFGRFTVFQSDQLAVVQQAVTLFDRLVVLLPLLTLLLAVVMVVVSVHRLRTLLALGVALVVSMILTNALFQAVSNQVVGLITGTGAKSAALTLTANLLAQLRGITNWVLVLGLVLAVGAFLAGDSRPAKAIRHHTRAALGRMDTAVRGEQPTAPSPDEGATGRVLVWVTDHATLLRYAGLVAAIGWLALVSATWTTLIVVLVLLALYELAIELLAPSFLTTRPQPAAESGGAPTSGG